LLVAPTVCRHTVSGLFHSPPGVLFTFPSRYWFTIGGNAYLALAGGPAGFPQGFSCPVVLGMSFPPDSPFAYAPLTLFGTAFQPSSTRLVWFWIVPRPRRQYLRFRLVRFRSPLLPESRLFSLPRRTKMFQFRRCPSFFLCVQKTMTTLLWPGFPIRIPPDRRSLAAPRSVSPLAASFLGTLPQGIHHAPFSASSLPNAEGSTLTIYTPSRACDAAIEPSIELSLPLWSTTPALASLLPRRNLLPNYSILKVRSRTSSDSAPCATRALTTRRHTLSTLDRGRSSHAQPRATPDLFPTPPGKTEVYYLAP